MNPGESPNTMKETEGSVPAWMMSIALHASALILVAILLRPEATKPRTLDRGERAAAIVLTRTDATARTEYFDRTDVTNDPSESEQEVTESSASATAAELRELADAMPQPAEAPLLPELRLPSADVVLSPGSDPFLTDRDLAGRQGRGTLGIGGGDDEAERALVEQERRARRAGRPTGPPARVSVFGSPAAVGHSFVFVIDRSKSMGSDGLGVLEAARAELDQALGRLRPEHRFQIIAYNQQNDHLGERRLKPASEENRAAAARFVADIAAYGATEHQAAVMSALHLDPDVIFLLTDGGYPELDEGGLRLIRRAAAGRTSIHCIRFGFHAPQESDHFMGRLARENRGTYSYVDMSKRP